MVLTWGVFVRTWGLSERSFWRDEAAVANVVLKFSYAELLTQEEVPIAPLFAVTTKLTNSLMSPPEVGLRLVSVICGIVCLPLIYLLLRTLRIARVTSLVGMTFCSSCPWLVIWSRELKHYEVEAFFAVLLALLVFRLRRCSIKRYQRMLAVGISGVCLIGPWFGYGFVFSGVSLLAVLVLLRPVFGSRKVTVITGMAGACVLLGSIGLLWSLTISSQSSNAGLLGFMGNWFIDPASFWSWARAGIYGLTSTFKLVFPFDIGSWFIDAASLWPWAEGDGLISNSN